jgi:isopentenyl-diphosphate delta-isomerase
VRRRLAKAGDAWEIVVMADDILRRKTEHIDVVLSGLAQGRAGLSGFDAVRLDHVALPELDLDGIDLSTSFLGKRLRAPWLISSMTGGPQRAEPINAALAEAAGMLGIALAVGSQRVALEAAGSVGFDRTLRRRAGNVPILANVGAAQVRTFVLSDQAERALEMIDADALIIHLNPLQEAMQAHGDRDWRGVFDAIAVLVRRLSKPVIVKEVGHGVSGALARRLLDVGVAAIDVAGAGGTNWATVEGARSHDPRTRAIAAAFHDWGIPTVEAIRAVRAAVPQGVVIASGGVRHGVDAAKAIALGADLVGQAAGVLPAAMEGPEAVVRHFDILTAQLRVACFCTGSGDLGQLRMARLSAA